MYHTYSVTRYTAETCGPPPSRRQHISSKTFADHRQNTWRPCGQTRPECAPVAQGRVGVTGHDPARAGGAARPPAALRISAPSACRVLADMCAVRSFPDPPPDGSTVCVRPPGSASHKRSLRAGSNGHITSLNPGSGRLWPGHGARESPGCALGAQRSDRGSAPHTRSARTRDTPGIHEITRAGSKRNKYSGYEITPAGSWLAKNASLELLVNNLRE